MSAAGPRPEALRAELTGLLGEWGVAPELLVGDGGSLLRSGAVDSVALFNLSMWIEAQIGRPVDPSAIDVLEAWDSVASILAYIADPDAATGTSGQGRAAPPATSARTGSVTGGRVSGAASPEYDVDKYRNGDLDAVARLFVQLWSPNLELNRRVFRWKYFDNPATADPLIYVVRHQGRVVAMRALSESLWEAEGTTGPTTLYCADDFIVEGEHQNHGLYGSIHARAVQDVRERGHAAFISLSALRVTRLQALVSGSTSVLIGPPRGRLSRRAAFADGIARIAERTPAAWRLARLVTDRGQAEAAFLRLDDCDLGSGIEVSRQGPVEEMAALVARLRHDGRIRQLRDPRYLAWRLASPLNEYRVVTARRGGRLVAYLVLSRSLSQTGNRRRVHVADWAAEDQEFLQVLLSRCLRAAAFAEIVTWSDAADARWDEQLNACGFGPIDVEQTARGLPCLLVHRTAEASAKLGRRSLEQKGDWDLRMIYTSYA
jgi:hypothetical protein